MQSIARLLALASLILLASCAQPYRRLQMYSGAPKPDGQLAAVINGVSYYQGETVVGILVGVDDALCPGPDTKSPGLPDNACGNNTLVEPGTHKFRVVLQTVNKVSFGYPAATNSWKRSAPFFIKAVELEAGMMYEVIPIIGAYDLSAKITPLCKSTNHEQNAREVRSKKVCV